MGAAVNNKFTTPELQLLKNESSQSDQGKGIGLDTFTGQCTTSDYMAVKHRAS